MDVRRQGIHGASEGIDDEQPYGAPRHEIAKISLIQPRLQEHGIRVIARFGHDNLIARWLHISSLARQGSHRRRRRLHDALARPGIRNSDLGGGGVRGNRHRLWPPLTQDCGAAHETQAPDEPQESEDTSVRTHTCSSEKSVRILTGHTSAVRACRDAPDGTQGVLASDDGTVKLGDARLGAALLTLIHGPNGQTAAIDSRHNRIVAASSEAGHFLGWRYVAPDTNRLRLLPAEYFGPLPPRRAASHGATCALAEEDASAQCACWEYR